MKTQKHFIWLFLLATVMACHPARKAGAPLADDGVIEIVFLHINDVYEIAPLSDNSGGLARVAALRKSLLAKNPNTFTVLAGDFISPSVIGTLKYEGKRIRGRQMIETLNALGVNWVVFGNHEFDYEQEDLQARLDESNFTWMAANARLNSAGSLRPFFKNRPGGPEPCPDQVALEVKDADGTTINLGLFGVLVTTGQKSFVSYSEPLAAAVTVRENLRSKTDVCVALTHLDVEDDLKLAGMLPDLPLIMGGHDHDNMMHRMGKTVVAKADANARTVYVHTLRYDKKKGAATVKSELRRIDGSIPEEPATAAVVAKWESIKAASLSADGFDAGKNVTELKEPLDCREATVRHLQAPVGKMIVEAMAAVSKNQPDCAVLNGGSIRMDDVLTGTVTELDIVRMLPFGGGISEVEMRGSLLQRTLDAGMLNKGKGGYLHWYRISRDEAGSRWLVGGAALDPKKIYRVTLPDFLLTGNETNMDFLKAAPSADGKSTTNPDILRISRPAPGDKDDLRSDLRQALIQYLRTAGK